MKATEKHIAIGVWITKDQYAILKAYKKDKRVSVSEQIRDLLDYVFEPKPRRKTA